MPSLYDEVELMDDLSEYGLRAGERGAVVDTNALSRGAVTVEFYRDDSVHLVSVEALRITHRSIPHDAHIAASA
jgi:hypothetical protein